MPNDDGKLTHEDGEKMSSQYFQGFVVSKLEGLADSDKGQWTEINKLKEKHKGESIADKVMSFLGGIVGGIIAVVTLGFLKGGK